MVLNVDEQYVSEKVYVDVIASVDRFRILALAKPTKRKKMIRTKCRRGGEASCPSKVSHH